MTIQKPTVAIIPTRSRPDDFADCVRAIRSQVDIVVAVAHGDEAREYTRWLADIVVPYDAPVPNISRMWRMGMDAVPDAGWAAVLNDDCIVPKHWFADLRHAAARQGAVGASGWRSPTSKKIAGFAFILDLDSGVYPDERLRWWYSDDAIQRLCEAQGGFALVRSVGVDHRHPNESAAAMAAVSAVDRHVYRRNYRVPPVEWIGPSEAIHNFGLLVADQIRNNNAAIEEMCEKMLMQDGTGYGVLVENNPDSTVTVTLTPEVPFGEIHYKTGMKR